jgi:hypothetical protein
VRIVTDGLHSPIATGVKASVIVIHNAVYRDGQLYLDADLSACYNFDEYAKRSGTKYPFTAKSDNRLVASLKSWYASSGYQAVRKQMGSASLSSEAVVKLLEKN